MISIDKIKKIFEYLSESFKKVISNFPDVVSEKDAIKRVSDDSIAGFVDAVGYIKRYKHVKDVDGRRNPSGIYYLGFCGSSDDNETFDKAKKVIEDVFGKDKSSMTIAVYDNMSFVFYYMYHNGLNGFGNFSDYMIDAAKKLETLNKSGIIDGTIVDVANDSIDDVADWLFKFRI